jgi:hypothetical protein
VVFDVCHSAQAVFHSSAADYAGEKGILANIIVAK